MLKRTLGVKCLSSIFTVPFISVFSRKDNCSQRKNYFSPIESHWTYNYGQTLIAVCSQHKTNTMVLFCFVFWSFFFSVSCTLSGHYFIFTLQVFCLYIMALNLVIMGFLYVLMYTHTSVSMFLVFCLWLFFSICFVYPSIIIVNYYLYNCLCSNKRRKGYGF